MTDLYCQKAMLLQFYVYLLEIYFYQQIFIKFNENYQFIYQFIEDAAWARAGFLKFEDLDTLRSITSKIEGHPTPD